MPAAASPGPRRAPRRMPCGLPAAGGLAPRGQPAGSGPDGRLAGGTPRRARPPEPQAPAGTRPGRRRLVRPADQADRERGAFPDPRVLEEPLPADPTVPRNRPPTLLPPLL